MLTLKKSAPDISTHTLARRVTGAYGHLQAFPLISTHTLARRVTESAFGLVLYW